MLSTSLTTVYGLFPNLCLGFQDFIGKALLHLLLLLLILLLPRPR